MKPIIVKRYKITSLLVLLAARPLVCFAATADYEEPMNNGAGDYGSFQDRYLQEDSFAKGIREGEFIIKPQITAGAAYDDNIYQTEHDAISDTILLASPSLAVQSDWGEHALNFNASDQSGRYLDHSTENYDDWSAGVDGRLDILRDLHLIASTEYAFAHEARGLPDNATGVDPNTYDQLTNRIALVHDVTRITATLGGQMVKTDYDNNITVTGAPIINSTQDQTQYEVDFQTGYEVSGGLQVFARTTGNEIRFDDASSAALDNSKGYTIDVGAAFGPNGKLKGQWYVGYLDQTYDSPSIPQSKGPDYGGKLLWLSSDLSQIEVTGDRSIQPTLLLGSPGILQSTASVYANYQLLREVMLKTDVSFANDKYNGVYRTDNILGFDLGARYFLNEHVAVDADYAFTQQDSNVVGGSYNDNRFTLGLLLGL